MTHRSLDEIALFEAQLADIDAAITAGKSAAVVDLAQLVAARRRRADVQAWLDAARTVVTQ